MAAGKVICDTDVMIDYFDRNKKRHNQTTHIIETEIRLDQVVLTAITKMELLAGASNNSEMVKIEKGLSRFNLILLNEEITLSAFRLMIKYRCSHGLALPDCLIAATVLHFNLPLFSYNKKDFRFISGLELYKLPDK